MADTKWKPGQSGNPNGRPPKEQSLTDILRSKVDAEEMAELMIGLAREGDLAAIKAVYDRVDGKPRESVDMNHSGDVNFYFGKEFEGV